MKAINYFFNKAPLWVVFLISVVSCLLICSFLFLFLFVTIVPKIEIIILLIKIMFILSIVMSGFITLIVKQSRLSDIYWEQSHKVENLINDVYTKSELEDLRDINMINLRYLINTMTHYTEYNRLKSLIDIKIDTIEKMKK